MIADADRVPVEFDSGLDRSSCVLHDENKPKRRCYMAFSGDAESAFTIIIHAEAALGELLDDGPEPFAKHVRSLLEAELKPLLEMDWKKVRRPSRPQDAP
jgi:hypothetical protein